MKKITQLVVAAALAAAVSLPALAARHEQTAAQETKAAMTHRLTSAIDLNTATLAQLMQLKGIGQKRAEDIIKYRQANGKFASVEDLAKVKGFSAKRIERLMKQNPGRIEVH